MGFGDSLISAFTISLAWVFRPLTKTERHLINVGLHIIQVTGASLTHKLVCAIHYKSPVQAQNKCSKGLQGCCGEFLTQDVPESRIMGTRSNVLPMGSIHK